MNEDFNDALVECVKALGGSKQVGPRLWPEKTPEAAQRLLLDCLNDERPAKLSPEHVLLVLRMARERGCHIGIQFLCESLGYADPVPVEPRDEAAELQRQYIEAARQMGKLAERIERLSAPSLRSAA
jgi:hypothetical protein